MIMDVFHNDQQFVGALDKAFESVVNHRGNTKVVCRSPELLARWVSEIHFDLSKSGILPLHLRKRFVQGWLKKCVFINEQNWVYFKNSFDLLYLVCVLGPYALQYSHERLYTPKPNLFNLWNHLVHFLLFYWYFITTPEWKSKKLVLVFFIIMIQKHLCCPCIMQNVPFSVDTVIHFSKSLPKAWMKVRSMTSLAIVSPSLNTSTTKMYFRSSMPGCWPRGWYSNRVSRWILKKPWLTNSRFTTDDFLYIASRSWNETEIHKKQPCFWQVTYCSSLSF